MKNTDMTTLVSRATVYIEEENVIWIATAYAAFLVKLNLTTRKFEEYYEIPLQDIENANKLICVSMCKYGDELIIAPCNMENIVIFNLKTHGFNCVEIPLQDIEKKTMSKIAGMCIKGKYIYMIGYMLHAIFRLDVEQKKCERIYSSAGEGIFVFKNAEIYADKMYLPMYEESKLLVMDLESTLVEEVLFDLIEESGFSSIVKEEAGVGLITREGTYISYDIGQKKKRSFKISKEEIFDIFIDKNKNMWCFEFLTDGIWHVSGNGEVERVNFDYPYIGGKNNRSYVKYFFRVQTKEGILFQVKPNGYIYNIDVDKKRIKKIDIVHDIDLENDLEKRIYKKRIKGGIIFEDSRSALENFLTAVIEGE